jgi:hypothetical protein
MLDLTAADRVVQTTAQFRTSDASPLLNPA